MKPAPGGYPRKTTRSSRSPMGRRPRARRPQPRVGSGLVLSVLLHMMVVAALLPLADLATAPVKFDVFAAEPLDAAPEPAVVRSLPEAARPKSAIASRRSRPPRPARARVSRARRAVAPTAVVASAASKTGPADRGPTADSTGVAPGTPTIPLAHMEANPSPPAVSDADIGEPLSGGPLQPSFAALEPVAEALAHEIPAIEAAALEPRPEVTMPRSPVLAAPLQPVPA